MCCAVVISAVSSTLFCLYSIGASSGMRSTPYQDSKRRLCRHRRPMAATVHRLILPSRCRFETRQFIASRFHLSCTVALRLRSYHDKSIYNPSTSLSVFSNLCHCHSCVICHVLDEIAFFPEEPPPFRAEYSMSSQSRSPDLRNIGGSFSIPPACAAGPVQDCFSML